MRLVTIVLIALLALAFALVNGRVDVCFTEAPRCILAVVYALQKFVIRS
jgi:hypothetical protein